MSWINATIAAILKCMIDHVFGMLLYENGFDVNNKQCFEK